MVEKFTILVMDTFEKEFLKLDNAIRLRFKKKFSILLHSPFSLGKPLSVPWLRELKVDKFRLYYLVEEDILLILFIALSNKNNQSERISEIKEILRYYCFL